MDPKPPSGIEGLLHAWNGKLRQHEAVPRLARRLALMALTAVLAYLGIDIPDLPGDEEI